MTYPRPSLWDHVEAPNPRTSKLPDLEIGSFRTSSNLNEVTELGPRDTHTFEHEGGDRGDASMSQGLQRLLGNHRKLEERLERVRPHREPALLMLRSRNSSIQDCETRKCCCLSLPQCVALCTKGPGRLMSRTATGGGARPCLTPTGSDLGFMIPPGAGTLLVPGP